MTSSIVAGAMTGALSCGSFMKYGKRKIILMMNFLLIISAAVCQINNLTVIAIARFFWGLSFGVFSVACPKFNTEITPVEYRGPFGATLQLMCTIGIMVPSLMALYVPSPINRDTYVKDGYQFAVDNYWRLIWAVPILVAIIHIALLMCCFRNETPVFLKEQGREQELLDAMKRYYKPQEIKARMAALAATEKDASSEEITYAETFFDKRIRLSAWVGVLLATF